MESLGETAVSLVSALSLMLFSILSLSVFKVGYRISFDAAKNMMKGAPPQLGGVSTVVGNLLRLVEEVIGSPSKFSPNLTHALLLAILAAMLMARSGRN